MLLTKRASTAILHVRQRPLAIPAFLIRSATGPMDLLSRIIIRQRLLVWCVIITLTGFSIAGICGYRLVGKRKGWRQSPRNEERKALSRARESFRTAEVGCFLVLESDDFFQVARLRALQRMITECQELRRVNRIVWLNSLPAFNQWGLPSKLIPTDVDQADVAVIKRRVLAHPLVEGQLLSKSQTAMMFPVLLDGWDRKVTGQLSAQAKKSLQGTGIQARLTGSIPLLVSHNHFVAGRQWSYSECRFCAGVYSSADHLSSPVCDSNRCLGPRAGSGMDVGNSSPVQ